MDKTFTEFGKFYQGDFEKFGGPTGVAKIGELLQDLNTQGVFMKSNLQNHGDNFSYTGGHGHMPDLSHIKS